MKTQYVFDDDLATLRILLSKEHQFSDYRRYLRPIHTDLQPLVITLEKWLREQEGIESKDERREIRLAILSLILECKVETTYDLSVYQCSCISRFLWFGPTGTEEEPDQDEEPQLRQRAVWFLEDCKDRVEGKSRNRAGRTAHRERPQYKLSSIMPDLLT